MKPGLWALTPEPRGLSVPDEILRNFIGKALNYLTKAMKINLLILALVLWAGMEQAGAQTIADSTAPRADRCFITSLYHQHHDFFGKPFSFQGVEAGMTINRRLLLGLYASFFAGRLKAEIDQSLHQVWMGQGGIYGGYVLHPERRFHPGAQLNAGLFSLRAEEAGPGLARPDPGTIKENGLVLAPQVFGELRLTSWFSLRTGFSYNFYLLNDHPRIHTSDLNRLSFTFSLVFGCRKAKA